VEIDNSTGIKHRRKECGCPGKTCAKCEKTLCVIAFIRQSGGDQGRRDLCRVCEKGRGHGTRQRKSERPLTAKQLEAAVELRKLPYDEYLKSAHWQRVRRSALKRADYRCQICNTSDEVLTIHHRQYKDVIGAEKPSDLICLCWPCHELFHINGKLKR
jgi:5-methylcytosine-specific restriction endonuclease McrA